MNHNHNNDDSGPFEPSRAETTGYNTITIGQVGSGKTHRLLDLAGRVEDETETHEWIDPKGERDEEENDGS